MSLNKDWFESWFGSPYYEMLYHKRDETEAKQFIDSLLNFLNPPPYASVLDLACGSGRHAIYLASKGYNVTGIDLSKELIEKANNTTLGNLNFYIHDMRNEFRINYFDFTFNFFTSFGYFNSEHDNFRSLENVCKGLKPEGTFVIDYFNLEYVKQHLVEEERQIISNVEFKISREIANGLVIKHIEVNDDGTTHHFREKVQALTLDDFKRYFGKMCLAVSTTFGDYNLSPYKAESSERLIIIAKKKDA